MWHIQPEHVTRMTCNSMLHQFGQAAWHMTAFRYSTTLEFSKFCGTTHSSTNTCKCRTSYYYNGHLCTLLVSQTSRMSGMCDAPSMWLFIIDETRYILNSHGKMSSLMSSPPCDYTYTEGFLPRVLKLHRLLMHF